MVAQVLDSSLQSAGVRAIVTSRAKNPTRLETKVRQRAIAKSYATVEDVYNDIVDLAGVRVALYFPAERDDVGKIITSLFIPIDEPKQFPTKALASYKKRFSGYWATHYRVRLPESLLNESQKRYTEARIEIQVASVLMHAWSEVEHDLVYKPLQGKLSEEEYQILDELNGLVLAGEIALERLQRAGEIRVSVHDREYTNHYDLASSVLEMARDKLAGLNVHDAVLGRMDLLFDLLSELELNTPGKLVIYISALHTDFERRPIAEQITDQILSDDPSRYAVFEKVRISDAPIYSTTVSDITRFTQSEAIGEFMALWIDYEKMIRSYAASKGAGGLGIPSIRVLKLVAEIPDDLAEAAERLRRFRNQLVHGIEIPDSELLHAQSTELRMIVHKVREIIGQEQKPPRKTVRKTAKPQAAK